MIQLTHHVPHTRWVLASREASGGIPARISENSLAAWMQLEVIGKIVNFSSNDEPEIVFGVVIFDLG